MDRRLFLRSSIAGAAAIAVTPSAFLTSCGKVDQNLLDDLALGSVGGTQVAEPPFTEAFVDFNQISALSASITASKNSDINLHGLNGTTCYGYYNDNIWGPTLHLSTGETANISFENNVQEITNLHFHGLNVSAAVEGGVESTIGINGTSNYTFTVNNRAGLYWYHPHVSRLAGKQLYLGLGGLFKVSDAEESALNLPSGGKEMNIVLADKRFNEDDTMFYGPCIAEKIAGYFGETVLVNGISGPVKDVSTRIYRLRMLNASTARIYSLGLDNDTLTFNIIGSDGGLLANKATANTIYLAPGERIDALVDFSGLAVGDVVTLYSKGFGDAGKFQGLEAFDILKFNITTAETETYSIPTSLSVVPDLTDGDVTGETRTIDIANADVYSDASLHAAIDDELHINNIDGDSYDKNTVNYTVTSGTTVKWMLDNTNGDEPKAIHIYGVQFQVTDRVGGRDTVKQWENGWKDTVLVLPGEKVTLIIPFNQEPGVYYMHSTNLEQADSGLMASIEVV